MAAVDSAQSLGTSAVFFFSSYTIRVIARIDWEARMARRFGKTCELTARCLYIPRHGEIKNDDGVRRTKEGRR